jgi:anti-sigma factor RsiW
MAGGEDDEVTCQELVELVTDYLEGVMPEAERVRLEAHLAECPYCEEYIAQMRQTIDALGKLTLKLITRERQEQLLEAFRGWRSDGSAEPRNARGAVATEGP